MSLNFFHPERDINFTGFRYIGYAFSAVLLLVGLVAAVLNGGPTYGVDFAGGAAVQIGLEKPADDEAIKKTLAPMHVAGLMVQQYGSDGKSYLIRFAQNEQMSGETVRSRLLRNFAAGLPDNSVTIERFEMVGPKVGADLRNAALQAMYFAILLITVYISGRFEQRWMIAAVMACALGGAMYLMGFLNLDMSLRVSAALAVTLILCWRLKLNFALGAIIGLIHDVLATIGILILLGREFDLNIIAALLTLVGYSLNDTIIIYDRIRESLRNQKPKQLKAMSDIINSSVTRSLGRTIMTSVTTLVAALSLYILGGDTIRDFALTMILGVIIGTYSTIFVCSPVLLIFGDTEHYLRPVRKTPAYERPGEHGVV
ncbi:MAG: protein translocase subunit SecF [Desulfovibrionaceae bacterium]|nr:protein translocase subunit SecF [Desulfovibrionaceae bacterium]